MTFSLQVTLWFFDWIIGLCGWRSVPYLRCGCHTSSQRNFSRRLQHYNPCNSSQNYWRRLQGHKNNSTSLGCKIIYYCFKEKSADYVLSGQWYTKIISLLSKRSSSTKSIGSTFSPFLPKIINFLLWSDRPNPIPPLFSGIKLIWNVLEYNSSSIPND